MQEDTFCPRLLLAAKLQVMISGSTLNAEWHEEQFVSQSNLISPNALYLAQAENRQIGARGFSNNICGLWLWRT